MDMIGNMSYEISDELLMLDLGNTSGDGHGNGKGT